MTDADIPLPALPNVHTYATLCGPHGEWLVFWGYDHRGGAYCVRGPGCFCAGFGSLGEALDFAKVRAAA